MENVIFYLLGCSTILIIVFATFVFYSLRENRDKIKSLGYDVNSLRESNKYLSDLLAMDRKEMFEIINRESQTLSQGISDSRMVLDNRIDDLYRTMDKRFESLSNKQTL
jgi:transposase